MSSSVFPWKWVIESLADIPDVDTSILSDLVDMFPAVLADSSVAVRERLALRYLENCSGMACGETPPAVATNAPSTSASAAKIDEALTCEEVLLAKVTTANGNGEGKACLDGGDLHQFILLKRATLPKSSIDLLKEKILGSSCPDLSYSKGCDSLPEASRPARADHLTSNNHSDHDGMKKIIRTMKYSNPLLKNLTIIRKYRKLKNLANNTPLRTVGGASQKNSCTQQHFQNQQVPDEKMRNQQTNVDGSFNFQFFPTEKTKKNTHKVDSSGHVPAPNGKPNNFEESLRSDPHDARADPQELADGACNDDYDVQLLEQSSMPESSSAQNLCMKCSRTGQLWNCHGDGCSRSIHGSCLGLLSGVEENGLFFCPFCAYRNARMIYEKSKRKAEEARRNLFSFYDIDPTVNASKMNNSSTKIMAGSEHPDSSSNQQFRNSFGSQKHDDIQNAETSNSKFAKGNNINQNQRKGADDIVCKIIMPCRETIERHIHKDIQDTPMKSKSESGRELKVAEEDQRPVEDHGVNENGEEELLEETHERIGGAGVTDSRNEVFRDDLQVEEIKNVHTGDKNHAQIPLQPSKRLTVELDGEHVHNAKRKALASQFSDRFLKRERIDKTKKIGNYEGVVENQQTDSSSLRELRKSTYQKNLSFTQKQSPSRRTKLIWKPEEEEILEEAMQKIPKNEDGSIPWISILEYGRRFFHESRTPIDLKDKWRNMQKKEAKKCAY